MSFSKTLPCIWNVIVTFCGPEPVEPLPLPLLLQAAAINATARVHAAAPRRRNLRWPGRLSGRRARVVMPTPKVCRWSAVTPLVVAACRGVTALPSGDLRVRERNAGVRLCRDAGRPTARHFDKVGGEVGQRPAAQGGHGLVDPPPDEFQHLFD